MHEAVLIILKDLLIILVVWNKQNNKIIVNDMWVFDWILNIILSACKVAIFDISFFFGFNRSSMWGLVIYSEGLGAYMCP